MANDLNGAYQGRAEKHVFSMLGDTIAKDLGYESLRGMDAIYRYLIEKDLLSYDGWKNVKIS